MDPEPDSVVTLTSPEGITTITINRPRHRNAIDPSTARKLHRAILAFEDSPSQKICILTGSHGTFCAGADLTQVAAMKQDPSHPYNDIQPVVVKTDKNDKSNIGPDSDANTTTAPVPPQAQSLGPLGPSRLELTKPLIAAVPGHAVAGGLELALLADLRVVEEDAVLGVFCRRWGVPLIDGGTVRLPAIIGMGRALDMILTGRGVGAQEALSMGLANRVVPKGKGLEEAERLAKSLLKFPWDCMLADRKAVFNGVFRAASMEEALAGEFRGGQEALRKEGVLGAGRFRDGRGRHGGFEKL